MRPRPSAAQNQTASPEAQLQHDQIVVGFGDLEYGVTMVPVTDLASARAAIVEIIEQGEGVDLDEPVATENGRRLQQLCQKIVNAQQEMSDLTLTAENWQDSGLDLIAAGRLLLSMLKQVQTL